MEEIIIDGINLTDLKARADALAQEQQALRKSIRKGAVKFVADNIKAALEAVELMKEAEDTETAKEHAQVAYNYLRNTQFVAGVADVGYDLPYYSEYGYNSGGEIITSILNDDENNVFDFDYSDKSDPMRNLYYIAEEMENDARDWNTSSC